MEDAEQRYAGRLLFGDHRHHHGAIGGIERGRRLIEQQHGMIGVEAAGDVDALLLTAGKGRGGRLQRRCGRLRRASSVSALARAVSPIDARLTSGSATTSRVETRGTVRRNWLT